MLNRKVSNYLFYFILVAIAVIVVLIRIVTIGNIDDKIETLKKQNIILTAQIANIVEIVEDNNDVQTSHLYELYNQVPSYVSYTELKNYTYAQLELVGITKKLEFQRDVDPVAEPTFPGDSTFSELQNSFKVVEVKVFFTTQDESQISDFINALYAADQIFIIHNVEYSTPDGEDYITVNIDFLSFYEKEDES